VTEEKEKEEFLRYELQKNFYGGCLLKEKGSYFPPNEERRREGFFGKGREIGDWVAPLGGKTPN